MKNQERSDKIKKLVLFLGLIIFSPHLVIASEYQDITDEIEIRYKWYTEIIEEGNYYPLSSISEDDKINPNKVKYGEYNHWDTLHCNASEEYYDVERQKYNVYRKVSDARTVLLEEFDYNDNIKIYNKDKLIDFDIISVEEQTVKIDLKINCMCENLIFYITGDNDYKITLYRDSYFREYIISKDVKGEQILVPNRSWVTLDTVYTDYITTINFSNSELTTYTRSFDKCRYREKYVYKYNVKKEYYDNQYHKNIDGYIKDTNDYRYYYKKEPIVNTIEVTKEKIVKVPKIEYVYIEKENNNQEIDSSQIETCTPKVKTEIKTKLVEKEIFKTPPKVYIIIIILVFLLIILIIKLFKKYVD